MDVGEKPQPKQAKRAPLWLRVLLMIVLILFVAFAFYLNNRNIIERLNE